ncbi:guanylate kinase [Chloracidobacterium aggregatum]|jgi:guanylate kinase|uniref:guanylate kinase n=1 Tax=Chloracidobacterium aggregatum TaxID=2851959 RepID=UPI001FE6549D|nr:guanylate kinase [Chloracidobacterium aggregatum]
MSSDRPHPLRRGMLVVVSAPSGGGKSTLLSRLLNSVDNLYYSISYTTRPPRPGERHGEHYYFVSPDDFERMREHGEFLESAVVHGHFYGTHRKFVETRLDQGHDLILDIDVQGAESLANILPEATRIFIMPPSYEVLRQRLCARGSDHPQVIARRLRNAAQEVQRFREFHYVIVNDDLERALRSLICIVTAERERWRLSEKWLEAIVDTFHSESVNLPLEGETPKL